MGLTPAVRPDSVSVTLWGPASPSEVGVAGRLWGTQRASTRASRALHLPFHARGIGEKGLVAKPTCSPLVPGSYPGCGWDPRDLLGFHPPGHVGTLMFRSWVGAEGRGARAGPGESSQPTP